MKKPDRDRIFWLLSEIEGIQKRDLIEIERKSPTKWPMSASLEHRKNDLKLVERLKAGKNHQFGFLYNQSRRSESRE